MIHNIDTRSTDGEGGPRLLRAVSEAVAHLPYWTGCWLLLGATIINRKEANPCRESNAQAVLVGFSILQKQVLRIYWCSIELSKYPLVLEIVFNYQSISNKCEASAIPLQYVSIGVTFL